MSYNKPELRIKAINKDLIVPTRSTEFSAGYDIYMPETVEVNCEEPTVVKLGFATEIPEGYVGLIYPRSSLGTKYGLTLTNTTGVIDSDYRGEWIVSMILNLDHDYINLVKGERAFQFIVVPALLTEPILVDELTETVRSTGGFGSTGV